MTLTKTSKLLQFSHSGGIFGVERQDIDSSEEVSIHAVHSGHVVKLSSVMEELTGMSRNKVPVDHRSQFKQIHNHTCRGDKNSDSFPQGQSRSFDQISSFCVSRQVRPFPRISRTSIFPAMVSPTGSLIFRHSIISSTLVLEQPTLRAICSH